MKDALRRLSIISALLMALSFVASLTVLDWLWAIVSAIGILALAVPKLAKKDAFLYHRSLLIISIVPFLLYLAVFIVNIFIGFDQYRYPSLIIMPLASMACGYMLFSSVDAVSEAVISKRWLFLFSVAFACTISVLYSFFLFYAMRDMGFLMYNSDFDGAGAPLPTDANHFFMLPINLAIVLSIVYGLLIDLSLKKVEAEDLTRYYGRNEA